MKKLLLPFSLGFLAVCSPILAGAAMPLVSIDVGDQVVSLSSIYVREAPGLTTARLGRVPSSTFGTVREGPTSRDGHDWYRVEWSATLSGWSSSKYLALAPAVGDVVVSRSGVYIRGSAGLNGERVGRVPSRVFGTVLEGPVSMDGHPWYRVEYRGQYPTGWSSGRYLTVRAHAGTALPSVVSPNGAEVFTVGGTTSITLQFSQGTKPPVALLLYRGSRALGALAVSTTTESSFSWKVGDYHDRAGTLVTGYPSSAYRIGVSVVGIPEVVDLSDDYFRIAPVPPATPPPATPPPATPPPATPPPPGATPPPATPPPAAQGNLRVKIVGCTTCGWVIRGQPSDLTSSPTVGIVWAAESLGTLRCDLAGGTCPRDGIVRTVTPTGQTVNSYAVKWYYIDWDKAGTPSGWVPARAAGSSTYLQFSTASGTVLPPPPPLTSPGTPPPATPPPATPPPGTGCNPPAQSVATDRYFQIGNDPKGFIYKGLCFSGNPSPGSHYFAAVVNNGEYAVWAPVGVLQANLDAAIACANANPGNRGCSTADPNALTGSCSYSPSNVCSAGEMRTLTWNTNDTSLNLSCNGTPYGAQAGSGSAPAAACPASFTNCTFTSATGKTGSISCTLSVNTSTPPPATPPPSSFPPPPPSGACIPPQSDNDPTRRWYALGSDPLGTIYGGLCQYSNPLPGSHYFAGHTGPNYGPQPGGNAVIWAPRCVNSQNLAAAINSTGGTAYAIVCP